MKKVAKIVALFLKDDKAENEIHRASLKFLKTAIAFLTTESLQSGGLVQAVIGAGIFSLSKEKRGKHGALVRKVLGKLIKKVGSPAVKKVTPVKHQALIEYIERERRKRLNKAKRQRLLVLLGRADENDNAKKEEVKRP